MENTISTAALVQGIEVALTQNRSSLSVETIELLEKLLKFLKELDSSPNIQKKRSFIFDFSMDVLKSMAKHEVIDYIRSFLE